VARGCGHEVYLRGVSIRSWLALAPVATVAALAGCGSASTTAQRELVSPRPVSPRSTVSTVVGGVVSHRSYLLADATPALSSAQVREALRLLHTSHALARLLHGVGYHVAHKGPWTTGGSNNRLVGVVFWLSLARATNMAGPWPTAVYEPKRFPPYVERSKHFTAREVVTLYVEVDLMQGVVGIVPSGREPSVSGPTTIPVAPPRAVSRAGGRTLAQFYLGRSVAAQSGCLACHRMGAAGNRGPGSDLTNVGSRLSRRGIERAILNPTAPMPSFRHLPKAKLRALVTFLSLLQ
jgi:mono/diheme cytochrome c family protein